VEFFKTLPSIDSPFDLRGPDFNLPASVRPISGSTASAVR
jgi:hypothetical protein